MRLLNYVNMQHNYVDNEQNYVSMPIILLTDVNTMLHVDIIFMLHVRDRSMPPYNNVNFLRFLRKEIF